MAIVIIGAGRAGSHLAMLLAERLPQIPQILIDGDILEWENLPNHELRDSAARWLNRPKAEGVAIEAAERYGVDITYLTEMFDVQFTRQDHPHAELIYEQDIIIAVTDDAAAQLAAAVTAAQLEIAFAASMVFADGSGHVFLQFDTDLFDCWGCFTRPWRLGPPSTRRLRGRELEPGIADHVDEFLANAVVAYLTKDPAQLLQTFSSPTGDLCAAWDIPARGQGTPRPIQFVADPNCPVCGVRARRARGVPRFPTSQSREDMRESTFVRPAMLGAVAMILVALFSLLIAKPGSGHWMIPYSIASWMIRALHFMSIPALVSGAAFLLLDGLIWAGTMDVAFARAFCMIELTAAAIVIAPGVGLAVQFLLIVAVYLAIMAAIAFAVLAIVAGALDG